MQIGNVIPRTSIKSFSDPNLATLGDGVGQFEATLERGVTELKGKETGDTLIRSLSHPVLHVSLGVVFDWILISLEQLIPYQKEGSFSKDKFRNCYPI